MKTYTQFKLKTMWAMILCCFLASNSMAATAHAAEENQPPVISFTRLDTNYPSNTEWPAENWLSWVEIGKEAVIRFEVSDPDPGDLITFDWQNLYNHPIFIDASFTPQLPHTGTGPFVVELRWTPTAAESSTPEDQPFLLFTASDQHGATAEYLFNPYVYLLAEIYPPTETVRIAAGESFSIPFAMTDNGDFMEGPIFYSPTLDVFISPLYSGPVWTEGELAPQGTPIVYYAVTPARSTAQSDAGEHQIWISVTDFPLLNVNEAVTVLVDPNCSNQYWYSDKDGDGYGTGPARAFVCSQIEGYADNNLDCDDTNADIGAMRSWYADADGDGYGDPSEMAEACSQPAGYVDNADDCAPADASIHPGAEEVWGDGIDNNCDGVTDEPMGCGAAIPLKLQAVCSDLASERKWMVINPNSCTVAVQWQMHKNSQKGAFPAPPGASYFTTTVINKGPEVAFIQWQDSKGKMRKKGMAAAAAPCKLKGKGKNARTAQHNLEPAADDLKVYPLPFRDQLSLQHASIKANVPARIMLISLEGRSNEITACMADKTDGLLVLDLKQLKLAAGLYLLKLEIAGESPVYTRVVLQK